MARGIVATKPGGTGGTSNGKVLVTDGTNNSTIGVGVGDPGLGTGDPGGLSTGTISTTTGSLAVSLDLGTAVSFTEVTKSNLGDVVTFDLDANGNAINLVTVIPGRVITGEHGGNHQVGADESILLDNAHIGGNVKVNGGTLVITNGSHIEGSVGSIIDNSYIIIEKNIHVEGKVEIKALAYLSIKDSVIEDSVLSSGGMNTIVTGCKIKNNLEIVNGKACRVSGNTVRGKTNTPGCTA